MNISDELIREWEQQIADAEEVRTITRSKGWKVICQYMKTVYEGKILDSFRRIPGDVTYDAGFRILQGEYQMLHHLMRVPQELVEIGEQAKRSLERTEQADAE